MVIFAVLTVFWLFLTNRQKQWKDSQNSKNDHCCTNRHMSTQSPPNTQSPYLGPLCVYIRRWSGTGVKVLSAMRLSVAWKRCRRMLVEANVTTLRSPYGMSRPSVVCLSSVTLLHPTHQRVELFGNIFAPRYGDKYDTTRQQYDEATIVARLSCNNRAIKWQWLLILLIRRQTFPKQTIVLYTRPLWQTVLVIFGRSISTKSDDAPTDVIRLLLCDWLQHATSLWGIQKN